MAFLRSNASPFLLRLVEILRTPERQHGVKLSFGLRQIAIDELREIGKAKRIRRRRTSAANATFELVEITSGQGRGAKRTGW